MAREPKPVRRVPLVVKLSQLGLAAVALGVALAVAVLVLLPVATRGSVDTTVSYYSEPTREPLGLALRPLSVHTRAVALRLRSAVPGETVITAIARWSNVRSGDALSIERVESRVGRSGGWVLYPYGGQLPVPEGALRFDLLPDGPGSEHFGTAVVRTDGSDGTVSFQGDRTLPSHLGYAYVLIEATSWPRLLVSQVSDRDLGPFSGGTAAVVLVGFGIAGVLGAGAWIGWRLRVWALARLVYVVGLASLVVQSITQSYSAAAAELSAGFGGHSALASGHDELVAGWAVLSGALGVALVLTALPAEARASIAGAWRGYFRVPLSDRLSAPPVSAERVTGTMTQVRRLPGAVAGAAPRPEGWLLIAGLALMVLEAARHLSMTFLPPGVFAVPGLVLTSIGALGLLVRSLFSRSGL